MDIELLLLIATSSLAGFAALGGWISHLKNRRPLEGFLLGAVLGPIGLLVELRKPFAHRPMIDPGAWDSFRSMVNYQADRPMLQLTDRSSGGGRRPLPALVHRPS